MDPSAPAALAPAPLTSGFLADWVASGQAAMAASPTYFANWDKLKTGLLLLALGGVAYLAMTDDEGGADESP